MVAINLPIPYAGGSFLSSITILRIFFSKKISKKIQLDFLYNEKVIFEKVEFASRECVFKSSLPDCQSLVEALGKKNRVN